MTTEIKNILTPVGRLVQGDCFKSNNTDAENRPLVIKNGPNAGQPRVEYYIGVAIPKTDPGWPQLEADIKGEARIAFPQLFDAAGNCINPKFAFKIMDGDSVIPNQRNKRPCDNEGFPGHWVLNLSNGFPPGVYSPNADGKTWDSIIDPNMVSRGDYVRVYATVKGNGSQSQPGVYLNHSMIEFVGHGEKIISGPDAGQVFGAHSAPMPAGASSVPQASPTPLAQPTPTPAPAAPATDFLNPAPPAVVKFKTPDGGSWTMAELLAVGYTAAQVQALPVDPLGGDEIPF